MRFIFLYFLIGRKLPCCIGLYINTMKINHKYTCVCSLLSFPPTPHHPSRSSQRARLDSLSYIATSHQLSILCMIMYVSMLLFQFIPPFPSPALSTVLFSMSTSSSPLDWDIIACPLLAHTIIVHCCLII